MKKIKMLSIITVLFFSFLSCEQPTAPENPDVIEYPSINFQNTKQVIDINGSITIAKTVSLPEGTEHTIEWTSSKKDMVTISKEGTITPLKAGKTTITAILKVGDKTYKDSLELTIDFDYNFLLVEEPKRIILKDETVIGKFRLRDIDSKVEYDLIWENSNAETTDAAEITNEANILVSSTSVINTDGSFTIKAKEVGNISVRGLLRVEGLEDKIIYTQEIKIEDKFYIQVAHRPDALLINSSDTNSSDKGYDITTKHNFGTQINSNTMYCFNWEVTKGKEIVTLNSTTADGFLNFKGDKSGEITIKVTVYERHGVAGTAYTPIEEDILCSDQWTTEVLPYNFNNNEIDSSNEIISPSSQGFINGDDGFLTFFKLIPGYENKPYTVTFSELGFVELIEKEVGEDKDVRFLILDTVVEELESEKNLTATLQFTGYDREWVIPIKILPNKK